MSGNDSDATRPGDDGLGGSWLAGSSNDELGSFLRDAIPAPQAGYWDAIDARLEQIERDPGHEDSMDIDQNVVRPMAMNTPSSPQKRPPVMWAVAAAMIVLAGIGVITLLNRSGNDAGLELATAPDATTEPVAPAPAGTSAPVVEPSAEVEAGSTTDAETVSSDGQSRPGPLTVMQQRLNGGADETYITYCFAQDATVPDYKVLDLSISADGSAVLFGLTPTNLVSGFAAGSADGQLSFELDLVTETTEPGPLTLALTDQTVTLAQGDLLGAVPCDQVAESLDRLRDIYAGREIIDPEREPAVAPIDDNEVLSSAGLGPIRIGMTVSELSTQLGAAVEFDTISERVVGECGWITTNIDDDIWVLVEVVDPTDAVVRRVTATSDRWTTPSGIRVGVPEQQVYDTFGDQLETNPHVYVPGGNYITFLPTDPGDPNTVEFWTEAGVVTEIQVGDRDWVGFVEGCA